MFDETHRLKQHNFTIRALM